MKWPKGLLSIFYSSLSLWSSMMFFKVLFECDTSWDSTYLCLDVLAGTQKRTSGQHRNSVTMEIYGNLVLKKCPSWTNLSPKPLERHTCWELASPEAPNVSRLREGLKVATLLRGYWGQLPASTLFQLFTWAMCAWSPSWQPLRSCCYNPFVRDISVWRCIHCDGVKIMKIHSSFGNQSWQAENPRTKWCPNMFYLLVMTNIAIENGLSFSSRSGTRAYKWFWFSGHGDGPKSPRVVARLIDAHCGCFQICVAPMKRNELPPSHQWCVFRHILLPKHVWCIFCVQVVLWTYKTCVRKYVD